MKTIKLAVFMLSAALCSVSFGDTPRNYGTITKPRDVKKLTIPAPIVKLPNLTIATKGVLFENNCLVDFYFKIYDPETCVETRVFVEHQDAPRLCPRLPEHLGFVNVWFDSNRTNTAHASFATNFSKIARRSMRGRIVKRNTVIREAKVKMNECGHQGTARLIFNHQEASQLRNIRVGRMITVNGTFRPDPSRQYLWTISHPQIR